MHTALLTKRFEQRLLRTSLIPNPADQPNIYNMQLVRKYKTRSYSQHLKLTCFTIVVSKIRCPFALAALTLHLSAPRSLVCSWWDSEHRKINNLILCQISQAHSKAQSPQNWRHRKPSELLLPWPDYGAWAGALAGAGVQLYMYM